MNVALFCSNFVFSSTSSVGSFVQDGLRVSTREVFNGAINSIVSPPAKWHVTCGAQRGTLYAGLVASFVKKRLGGTRDRFPLIVFSGLDAAMRDCGASESHRLQRFLHLSSGISTQMKNPHRIVPNFLCRRTSCAREQTQWRRRSCAAAVARHCRAAGSAALHTKALNKAENP